MKLIAQAVFLGCVFATIHAQDCSIGGFEVGGPAPVLEKWGEYENLNTRWFNVKRATHYRSKVTNHAGEVYTQFLAIKNDRLVAVIREFDGFVILAEILALEKKYGPPIQPPPWIKWWGWSESQGHVAWIDSACGLRIDAFNATEPNRQEGIVVWTKAAP